MASMFIRHKVADYAKWKAVFDEHGPTRKRAGFTAQGLGRDSDDPNTIIIAFRASDIRRAKEFAASEDLRSAMERAGVQGPPEIWFAEEIEDKRY